MCAPVFMMATLYGHSVTGSAGITSHNGHCQQNITLYSSAHLMANVDLLFDIYS